MTPRIEPYCDFKISPAACAFHYAFACFEGMKAYRDLEGKTRLFRPDRNFRRLNQSASRLALPNFDEAAMVQLLAQYVKLESRFIPRYAQEFLFQLPPVPTRLFYNKFVLTTNKLDPLDFHFTSAPLW